MEGDHETHDQPDELIVDNEPLESQIIFTPYDELNQNEPLGVDLNVGPNQIPGEETLGDNFFADIATMLEGDQQLFFDTLYRIISHVGFSKFIESLGPEAKENFKKSMRSFYQYRKKKQILTPYNVKKYLDNIEIFGN